MLDVTYPSAELVQRYLRGPVNAYVAKLDGGKERHTLSEEEARMVADTLGGCLTDLNYLLTCMLRGQRPSGAPIIFARSEH